LNQFNILVPDRRRLWQVNVTCAIVLACVGGKREKRGAVWVGVRDLKVGQLTLSMGPARAEVRSYIQRAIIPSKRVVYILK
jgi:hypothetical protein